MKKNEIIKAWKDAKSKEELSNMIGAPEVNKEVVRGGAEDSDSAGWICSVSGECWGFSCNPFNRK
ncbi:hypothetical protein C8N46_102125 [Kordia periserrulae]|uniref:Mersacidin/lichenicidin family type 2 lantibiotic n=1 Tax=Kordia periserrulae TaxID=701523 RepID=A0A2T6C350_9FLAO|nr:hypothetical protein [Kordia periserrulae]PTX62728.1 hypothetical protein C8N46_102125 [Kordia periserrulae]